MKTISQLCFLRDRAGFRPWDCGGIGTQGVALGWDGGAPLALKIPYTVGEADMKSILLPDDVYEQAAALAERDHVSVDRLVAAPVNEHVSEWSRLQERAARGSLEKLKRVLAKVSDATPEAADLL